MYRAFEHTTPVQYIYGMVCLKIICFTGYFTAFVPLLYAGLFLLLLVVGKRNSVTVYFLIYFHILYSFGII
jgi:hypothetical protein